MTNGQSARGVDTVGGEQQQPPLLQQRLLVASEQTSTPQTVGVGSRASKKRDEPVDRLLLLGCYTSFASMYMLVSFVAPFFPANADRWHLSHMQVGWICSCDAIGEVLSTAFATLVMAKMGCARAAVAGQIGNGISSLIFGLIPLVTQNETALFLGFTVMRLLNGAMTNITFIAVMAVLCNLMPDKIGQVAANIAVLSTIGLTLGPPFGGILTALGGSIVDGMNLERENGRNWQFATPFIGCTVLLLLPTFVLWKARHTIDAAEELDSGEEEVEVSFSEEWRRMKSIINKPVMAAVLATVVTSIGQDARDPILGPHLASRCADSEVIPGEHFPFDYTPLQISLVFSSTCLTFLPLSTYIGAQADIKGRDFAWLRRVMALGLGLEAVAFLLMGPSSMLPTKLIREMETDSCVVLSQMVLGMSNALTLIAAFPFIEGVCELTATTQLTQTQRMAVAGTWYNAAFSLGCALGPLTTGAMSDFVRFSDCVQVLSVISLIAMVCVYLEGVGNTGKVRISPSQSRMLFSPGPAG
jgi:MFS family permease